MTRISILILTKNEQHDLQGCLDSVAWSDDIHVYDSMSTDNTVSIAESFGAKISQRDYGGNRLAFGGNESTHRNWGLENIPFVHKWVFVIDADERMTPELAMTVNHAVISPKGCIAFRVQRRDFFQGTWLKHAQASPFYIRLFMHEKLRYKRLINSVSIAGGTVGQVGGYLDHFPFSKGLDHWLDRHNSYSRLEAQQIVENRKTQTEINFFKAFLSKDFHIRRYHQKAFFYRLPFRPLLKFLLLYVAKRGFLDGRAGFTYATLQSIYEYFIVLKTRELESQQAK